MAHPIYPRVRYDKQILKRNILPLPFRLKRNGIKSGKSVFHRRGKRRTMQLMDFFGTDDLRRLAERQDIPCISIFMTTQRTDAEQNRIRFKNLLGKAGRMLTAENKENRDMGEEMKSARNLLEDLPFWQHQSDGLALFMGDGIFQTYRLPLPFEDLAVVSNRFHIMPLLPLAMNDMKFYILALSQKRVRLFRCTRQEIERVDLEGMPEDLEDALKYDDLERQLQFHTGAAGTGGRRPAIFHGHGVGTDDAKDRIIRYFQEIDKWVHTVMREENSPLILSGVEFLLPLYKEVSSYPRLMEQGILGNPDELGETELHKKAWDLVAPHIRKAQEDAIARYKDSVGTGKTSNDLEEIITSAAHGRIGVLFIAGDTQKWGRFDPDSGMIEFHQAQDSRNEDLLNLAAVQTLTKGGDVYVMKQEEVPDDAVAAALFRY